MKEFVDKLIESFLGKCVIYAENYEKALNIANELTEEYSNGWIPCSERLPDYSDCYNVTVGVACEMGYYECVKAFDYVKIQGKEGRWVIPEDTTRVYNVIAWCELPAPYKEGE